MKIVFIKYRDPIIWFKPNERYYDSDVDYFELVVDRVAGILIKEDESKIVLGEVSLEEDNPKASEWGVQYPSYRYVIIIDKNNIIERKDFEV